jgi:biotin operon repressor
MLSYLLCVVMQKKSMTISLADGEIAETLGVSRTTVRKSRTDLENLGLIVCGKRKGGVVEYTMEIHDIEVVNGKAPEGFALEHPEARKAVRKRTRQCPVYTTGDIEEIYELYPRHMGKKGALAMIEKRIRGEFLPVEFLKEKVRLYSEKTREWPTEEKRYIPSPLKWFRDGHYMDDPSEWDSRLAKAGKRGDAFAMTEKDNEVFDTI